MNRTRWLCVYQNRHVKKSESSPLQISAANMDRPVLPARVKTIGQRTNVLRKNKFTPSPPHTYPEANTGQIPEGPHFHRPF